MSTVAKQAAQALGRDMPDALSRITRGVAKLEPELLDELGIFVRIDPAIRAYARSMGVASTGLTEFQRRQAFLNAVVAESSRKFSMIDTSVPSAQQSLEKLQATLTDLGITLAGFLANFLKPIADFFNGEIGNSIVLFGSIMLMVFGKAKSLVSDFVSTSMSKLSESINKSILDNEKYSASYDKLILAEKAFQQSIKDRKILSGKTGDPTLDGTGNFGQKGVPRDMVSRFKNARDLFNSGAVSSMAVTDLRKLHDDLDKDLKDLAAKGTTLTGHAAADASKMQSALATMLASTTTKTKILTTAFIGLEKGMFAIGRAANAVLSAFNWIFIVTTAVQLLADMFGVDLLGIFNKFFQESTHRAASFKTGIVGAFEEAGGGADLLTSKLKALGTSQDELDKLGDTINNLYKDINSEAASNKSIAFPVISQLQTDMTSYQSTIEAQKRNKDNEIASMTAALSPLQAQKQQLEGVKQDALQALEEVKNTRGSITASAYQANKMNAEKYLTDVNIKLNDINAQIDQTKDKYSLNIANYTAELDRATQDFNAAQTALSSIKINQNSDSTIEVATNKLNELKSQKGILSMDDQKQVLMLETLIKTLNKIPEGGFTLVGDISFAGGLDAGKVVDSLTTSLHTVEKEGKLAGLSLRGLFIPVNSSGNVFLGNTNEELQQIVLKVEAIATTNKDMTDTYLAGTASIEAMGSQLSGVEAALSLSVEQSTALVNNFKEQGMTQAEATVAANNYLRTLKEQYDVNKRYYDTLVAISNIQKGVETTFSKESKILDTAQWDGLISLSGKFATNQIDIAQNQATMLKSSLETLYVDKNALDILERKKASGAQLTQQEKEQYADLINKEGAYNAALKVSAGILVNSVLELNKMVDATKKQLDLQKQQNNVAEIEQRLAVAQSIQATEQATADAILEGARRALELEKQRAELVTAKQDAAIAAAEATQNSLSKLSDLPFKLSDGADVSSDIAGFKDANKAAQDAMGTLNAGLKVAGNNLLAVLDNPKLRLNPAIVSDFINQYKQVIAGMSGAEKSALSNEHKIAMQEIFNEQKKLMDQISNAKDQKAINTAKADLDKSAINAEAKVVFEQIRGYSILANVIDSWNKGVGDLAIVLGQFLESLPKSLGAVNKIDYKPTTPADLVGEVNRLAANATKNEALLVGERRAAIDNQTKTASTVLENQISGFMSALTNLVKKREDEIKGYDLKLQSLDQKTFDEVQKLEIDRQALMDDVRVEALKLVDTLQKDLKSATTQAMLAGMEQAISLAQERLNLESSIAQIGLEAQDRQLEIEKARIGLQTQYMDNAVQQLNILETVLENIKGKTSGKNAAILDRQQDTTKARLDTFATSVGNPKPLMEAQARVLELTDKASKSAKAETDRKVAIINYEIEAKKAIFALEIGQMAKEHQQDINKLLADQKNILGQISILNMQKKLNDAKSEAEKAGIIAEANIVLQQIQGYTQFATIVDGFNSGITAFGNIVNGMLGAIPSWLGGGGRIAIPEINSIATDITAGSAAALSALSQGVDAQMASIDSSTAAANEVLKSQSDALWAHFAENNQKGMDSQAAYELAVQQVLATQQNALDGLQGSADSLATAAEGGKKEISDLTKKLLALFDSIQGHIKTALQGFNDALFYRDKDTSFKSAMNDVMGNMFKNIQQSFFEQTIATPVSDFLTKGIFSAFGIGNVDAARKGSDNLTYASDNSLLVRITNWSEQDAASIGNFDTKKGDGSSWFSTLFKNLFPKDGFFSKLFSGGLGDIFKSIFGGLFGGLQAANGGVVHLAQGGRPPTSNNNLRDRVKAHLEPDEFVMRKVSAKRLGLKNLQYMNATGLLPHSAQTSAERAKKLDVHEKSVGVMLGKDAGTTQGLMYNTPKPSLDDYKQPKASILPDKPAIYDSKDITKPIVDKNQTNNAIGDAVMSTAANNKNTSPNVGLVVNNSGTPKEVQTSKPRFDGDKYIVDVIMRDLQNNGPIRKTLRS